MIRFQKCWRSGKQRRKDNDEKVSRLPWLQFRWYLNWSDACPGNRFCCFLLRHNGLYLNFIESWFWSSRKKCCRVAFNVSCCCLNQNWFKPVMRLVPEVKQLSKFLPIRWSSKQTATGTEMLQIHVNKSPTAMIRKRKYSTENQEMLLTKHWLNPFITFNLK